MQWMRRQAHQVFSKRCLLGAVAVISMYHHAQPVLAQAPVPVMFKDGRLTYAADAQGNRVPDFSYSGYHAGEQAIPNVPIVVVVPPQPGDATPRIQAAIDYVATRKPDAQGIRGAVLLQPGIYEVQGTIVLHASGIVLRGSGMGEAGTLLRGTGTTRDNLIRITGKEDQQLGTPVTVTDAYVPVGAMQVHVTSPHTFKPGDHITLRRPSTQRWIDSLGMRAYGGETEWLGWKSGERDIVWDRQILAIQPQTLTLDAPVTTALDTAFGTATVTPYTWPGRIHEVGIENLRCQSTYHLGNPKDEAHRWMAITFENIRDGWVRQVVFEHFAGSAVAVWESASRITVEDCKSLAPVSEIGGQRRYTFFTNGQQTLFQRLYAEHGYHDFATGFAAPGPNAWVQCHAYRPYSFSGAIDSWASGVLFDAVTIDGQELRLANREQDGQGAGWCAANSMLWQCAAAKVACYAPPTAHNWAFGAWGQFAGNGYWYEANSHIKPYSLYYAQLNDRLGETNDPHTQLMPIGTEATSSPSVEEAAALTQAAGKPIPTLANFIDEAPTRNPIPTAHQAKTLAQTGYKPASANSPVVKAHPITLQQGKLVKDEQLATGQRREVPWWRGDIRPHEWPKAKMHITRFVPGRTGPGRTDDLNAVTDTMLSQHIVALEHNYGLWYDRRRDDHERVRRQDGDVWPPFYELPFARSGQDTAWDGLSRYDLTRYNTWYWQRLQQFADLADQKGLMLIHQQYFQHNILEAGAHWADVPWRTANNINHTGFPEPPPYAGDKRIFLDAQFYDITNPTRRKLHEAYIRQCLNAFAQNKGVLQLISAEYTGPLHFVEFWIDTILAWEKETGHHAMIGLSTTKDVQDAILENPTRAAAMDVIDIRYWHYRHDGTLYAPLGGQHLAPRQHARLVKPGRPDFAQVYRAVAEYRNQYPDKAVIYSGPAYDQYGWAVLMAGGSLPVIPQPLPQKLLQALTTLQPYTWESQPQNLYALTDHHTQTLVYAAQASDKINIDLHNLKGACTIYWINPQDGRILKKDRTIKGGTPITLPPPTQHKEDILIWITNK